MKVKKFKHSSHFFATCQNQWRNLTNFPQKNYIHTLTTGNPNNTIFSQFERKNHKLAKFNQRKKEPLLPRQQSLQLFLVLLSVNLCWVGMRFNTKLLTSIIWDIFQGQRFIEVDLDKTTLDLKSPHLDSFKLNFVLSHSQVKRHEKVWPKLTTLY